MIVVGGMSVVCAFIFVTKFHSSKAVHDTTKSADASTAESSSVDAKNGSEDINDSDAEKDAKSEKVKSKSKKKDNDENNENGSSVLGKILVPMDSIVVNIGKLNSKRYLRVIISLEVKNSEIEETIKANKVIFRDKLVSFLSSKNMNEISEQANHYGLRTAIKEILNRDLLGSDDAISQVYFSDFIIQ